MTINIPASTFTTLVFPYDIHSLVVTPWWSKEPYMVWLERERWLDGRVSRVESARALSKDESLDFIFREYDGVARALGSE